MEFDRDEGEGEAAAEEPEDADRAPAMGGPTVGYMAPEDGPFLCAHCEHYTGPRVEEGLGRCDQPAVVAAPDLKGRVQGGGCCNLFEPEREE